MLNCSLFDYSTGAQSLPFPGISFRYCPQPSLTSIAGCVGSGSITSDCNPFDTSLVFQGNGLNWLKEVDFYSLHINAPEVSSFTAGMLLNVINDSYAILPLSNVFPYILLPIHFDGLVLAMYFSVLQYNFKT